MEEWQTIRDHFTIENKRGENVPIGDLFEVDFRSAKVREPLLCDLAAVVSEKATSAYEVLRVPFIVEHAGLIFEELSAHSYPGGLTQPMWDALGAERFVAMKGIAGSRVTAKAIVGYCDGMAVHLFEGQTQGVIAEKPRGARAFYWDPIFCPDAGGDRTFAEIADEAGGLLAKMRLSQSQKAITAFMNYRVRHEPALFV